MKIQDSGNRRKFKSGAVRDIAEGKGRCDLLPLDTISMLFNNDYILKKIDSYIYTGDTRYLADVIRHFSTARYKSSFTAILEVAKHYEDGCNKYGERNWQKGIDLHCYIDSGVRHYLKFLRGDKDEAHDRAFLWNMLGALWTQEHKPELIDLPFGDKKKRHLEVKAKEEVC